jgi:hypothetical protein
MSERYEREIDEIIYRLEGRRRRRRNGLGRKLSQRFQPFADGCRVAFGAFLRRPPPEQFMIAAMVLVIVSFLLGNVFGLAGWAFYTSVLSIVFFVLGFGLSLAGRHSPGYRRNWRGREIDYGGPTFWSKLRNWFRRPRGY